MILPLTSRYALRALAAMPGDGRFSRAKDIAEEVDLPAPYLAKILYTLSAAGLLESVRGPGGGIRLARAASAITLGEVVQALGGREPMEGCLMGLEACAGRCGPCALHRAWDNLTAQMDQALAQVTVRDLQLRHAAQNRQPRAKAPARRRTPRNSGAQAVA